MSDQPQTLIDVRKHELFLDDARDAEAALVRARRFAKDGAGPNDPFASAEEANDAADALKGLKLIRDAAEEHRKDIARPFLTTQRAIKAEYDELFAQPNAAIKVLEQRGLATLRKQKAEQQEAERLRREALQKQEEDAAAKAAEAARQAEDEPEDAEAQKQAADAHRIAANAAIATQQRQGEDAKPKQLRGSFASFGGATTYKWAVYDVAALPDEHTTFNRKTIDAAVRGEKAMAKAQGREFNLHLIPGVRIWPVERGVSR